MWAEKKNQYLIKYFRKKLFYNVFFAEQEDPEYPHKKEVWEMFYYYQYLNPIEVNNYQNGSLSYEQLMQRMANRINDYFYDYMEDAIANEWISIDLYDDYLLEYGLFKRLCF